MAAASSRHIEPLLQRSGRVKEFGGAAWEARATKDSAGAAHQVKQFDGTTWVPLP